MEVDIIGSGITSYCYDWTRKNKKWSVGSSYGTYKDNIDLYFCLHKNQNIKFKNVIDLNNYPLKEVIDYTKSKYFTNSIAYMMAYAIYKKVKKVNLFGIDMEVSSEYNYQRPCIAYWIAKLESNGIEVNISNKLNDPVFLYGFDSEKMNDFISVLNDRVKSYKLLANNEKDNDKKNQFIGAMYATDKIKDLIKG